MKKQVAMLTLRRFTNCNWCPLVRHCSVAIMKKESYMEKMRQGYLEDEAKNLVVPTFKRAMLHPDAIAVRDSCGDFTFFQVYTAAQKLAIQISNICGSASQSKVAILCPNNVLWLAMQWGCWMSGQVVVPLDLTLTPDELLDQVTSCNTKLMIGESRTESITQELALDLRLPSIVVDHGLIPSLDSVSSPAKYVKQLVGRNDRIISECTLTNEFYARGAAMLLYSANSTGGRNAVLLSHRNIDAQMKCVASSWRLTATDCLLPIMSMNRTHATIGALLGIGGGIVLQQTFDSHTAWRQLLGINSQSKQRVNLFLARPIIYKKLIAEYDSMFSGDKRMVDYIMSSCRQRNRLMASAFGLLPESVSQRWREITGQTILEYYGLLEMGFVLGPQLDEPRSLHSALTSKYRAGTLGVPLMGVTARLHNRPGDQLVCFPSEATAIEPEPSQVIGELEISGEHLYPHKIIRTNSSPFKMDMPLADQLKQEENRKSNVGELESPQLYFKTGDICSYENGLFNFLSKVSNVITVGGYRVYGSEIKKTLISHPNINDAAVLGVPHKSWGQRLVVVCILKPNTKVDIESIKVHCKSLLPAHKRPALYKTIPSKRAPSA